MSLQLKKMLMVWTHLARIVTEKKICPINFNRTYIAGIYSRALSSNPPRKPNTIRYRTAKDKVFYVYRNNIKIYIAEREAQSIALLLKRYTNRKIASMMCISERTVEFYFNRLRYKLNCYSKSHMLHTIQNNGYSPSITNLIHTLPKQKCNKEINKSISTSSNLVET